MNDLDKKIELLKHEKRKYSLEEKINIWEKIKLAKSVPIQKIMGYIEMANVKINISKKVLIPRYETEELIFHARELIQKKNFSDILDLCCGSGFIGIAIKKEFQNKVNVYQSDIDTRAIKQTKINCKINFTKNQIVKSNMFENIKRKFDLIISNPPYLKYDEKNKMDISVLKYEPEIALFADDEGLYFYKIIEKRAKEFLNENGMIALEINPLNAKWFKEKKYKVIKDINGKERFAFKSYSTFE